MQQNTLKNETVSAITNLIDDLYALFIGTEQQLEPLKKGICLMKDQDTLVLKLNTEKQALVFTIENENVPYGRERTVEIPLGLLTDFAGNPKHFALEESQKRYQERINDIITLVLNGIEEHQRLEVEWLSTQVKLFNS